jgi:hypothetical protein
MKYLPKILKAEKDLTGLLTINFQDQDPEAKEKEFAKAFSELRAGISWPFRAVDGYMCILGVLAGTRFGAEKAAMLVYEARYDDAMQLMTDAYNKAHDLRFQLFYTDCLKQEWRGFIHEFSKKVSRGLAGRNVRLRQSPFPNDFVLGKDLIRRTAAAKGFILPTVGILTDQLTNIRPEDLDTDHPEYAFPAVNAFRYLIVGWENDLAPSMGYRREPEISPLGWT